MGWQRIAFMCWMKLSKLFLALKKAEAARKIHVECIFCPLSVFVWHTYPPRYPSCLTSSLETCVDISLLNRASRGGQIPGIGKLPALKPAAHTLSGGHNSRAVQNNWRHAPSLFLILSVCNLLFSSSFSAGFWVSSRRFWPSFVAFVLCHPLLLDRCVARLFFLLLHTWRLILLRYFNGREVNEASVFLIWGAERWAAPWLRVSRLLISNWWLLAGSGLNPFW